MDQAQQDALIELLKSVGVATTFFTSIISPLFVALLTNKKWRSETKLLLAISITALSTVAGFTFDNKFTWPPAVIFWLIMIASFGTQQLVYNVFKKQAKQLELASTPEAIKRIPSPNEPSSSTPATPATSTSTSTSNDGVPSTSTSTSTVVVPNDPLAQTVTITVPVPSDVSVHGVSTPAALDIVNDLDYDTHMEILAQYTRDAIDNARYKHDTRSPVVPGNGAARLLEDSSHKITAVITELTIRLPEYTRKEIADMVMDMRYLLRNKSATSPATTRDNVARTYDT